jgi:hypothetical protein
MRLTEIIDYDAKRPSHVVKDLVHVLTSIMHAGTRVLHQFYDDSGGDKTFRKMSGGRVHNRNTFIDKDDHKFMYTLTLPWLMVASGAHATIDRDTFADELELLNKRIKNRMESELRKVCKQHGWLVSETDFQPMDVEFKGERVELHYCSFIISIQPMQLEFTHKEYMEVHHNVERLMNLDFPSM